MALSGLPCLNPPDISRGSVSNPMVDILTHLSWHKSRISASCNRRGRGFAWQYSMIPLMDIVSKAFLRSTDTSIIGRCHSLAFSKITLISMTSSAPWCPLLQPSCHSPLIAQWAFIMIKRHLRYNLCMQSIICIGLKASTCSVPTVLANNTATTLRQVSVSVPQLSMLVLLALFSNKSRTLSLFSSKQAHLYSLSTTQQRQPETRGERCSSWHRISLYEVREPTQQNRSWCE